MNEGIIQSDVFQLLQDEDLRKNACQAVDHFLKEHKPVKNAQLHAIPLIIQSQGFSGLRNLIENQKKKNTKKDNRAFWKFMADLILASAAPALSLRSFLQNQSPIQVLLQDEAAATERKNQKQIRKANKAIIDGLMERILPVYFEHFNCHYFYRTQQGA